MKISPRGQVSSPAFNFQRTSKYSLRNTAFAITPNMTMASYAPLIDTDNMTVDCDGTRLAKMGLMAGKCNIEIKFEGKFIFIRNVMLIAPRNFVLNLKIGREFRVVTNNAGYEVVYLGSKDFRDLLSKETELSKAEVAKFAGERASDSLLPRNYGFAIREPQMPIETDDRLVRLRKVPRRPMAV